MKGLAAISGAVFFSSLLVAGCLFYSGRQFDPTAAIISDLMSRDGNPRGYWIGAAGMAVSMALLFPVGRRFFHALRAVHKVWAALGAGLFLAGVVAGVADGFLTPFEDIYSPAHYNLPYAMLMLMTTGLAVCMFLAGRLARRSSARLGTMLYALAVTMAGVLGFLAYLYFAPDYPELGWWSSLAALEWEMCLCVFGYIYGLAAVLDKLHRARPVDP